MSSSQRFVRQRSSVCLKEDDAISSQYSRADETFPTPREAMRRRNCQDYRFHWAETYPSIRPHVPPCDPSKTKAFAWLADSLEANGCGRHFEVKQDDLVLQWQQISGKNTLGFYGVGSPISHPESVRFNQVLMASLDKASVDAIKRRFSKPPPKRNTHMKNSVSGHHFILNRRALQREMQQMPMVQRRLNPLKVLESIFCPDPHDPFDVAEHENVGVSISQALDMERSPKKRPHGLRRRHWYCPPDCDGEQNACSQYEWAKYKLDPRPYNAEFRQWLCNQREIRSREPKDYDQLYERFLNCFEQDPLPDPLLKMYESCCLTKKSGDDDGQGGGDWHGGDGGGTGGGTRGTEYKDENKYENKDKIKDMDKSKHMDMDMDKNKDKNMDMDLDKDKEKNKNKKDKNRDKNKNKIKDKDMGKDMNKDMDKGMDKDKNKDKDMDKDMYKDKNKNKNKDKDTDKEKNKDKNSDKDKNKDKNSDKDKNKDKEKNNKKNEDKDKVTEDGKTKNSDDRDGNEDWKIKRESQNKNKKQNEKKKQTDESNKFDRDSEVPSTGLSDRDNERVSKVEQHSKIEEYSRRPTGQRKTNADLDGSNEVPHVIRIPKDSISRIKDKVKNVKKRPNTKKDKTKQNNKFKNQKKCQDPRCPPQGCPCEICDLIDRGRGEPEAPFIQDMKRADQKRKLRDYYRQMCHREYISKCCRENLPAPLHKCDPISYDNSFCQSPGLAQHCECLEAVQDLQKILTGCQDIQLLRRVEELRRRISQRMCECILN